MHKIEINVAKDFAPRPFGRYPDDGLYNGTKFREEWLKPNLAKAELLVVDFRGCPFEIGSSFLEESFGGLVRELKIQNIQLMDKLQIIGRSDFMDLEIQEYIKDAKNMLKAS